MNTKDSIKASIIDVARLMYEKQMVNALEGNISCRIGDTVIITPSGVCKGYLQADMLLTLDMDGNVLEGTRKPSSETKIHLAAYRIRPDIRAAAHSHPPFATAYAIANLPIATKSYPEAIVNFDHIPIAGYGRPSTDEVHRDFAWLLPQTDVLLLSNHGVMSVGSDVFDAFFKMETAESIAKTLTIAKLHGGEKALSPERLDELYAMRKENLGKGKITTVPHGTSS